MIRSFLLAASFFFVAILSHSIVAPEAIAWESDQFTLKKQHIQDSGEILSEVTFQKLRDAVAKVNRDIREAEQEIEKIESTGKALSSRATKALRKQRKLVAEMTTEWYIAHQVCKALASSFPPCFAKDGVRLPARLSDDALIKANYLASIYAGTFIMSPFNMFKMAHNMRLYGIYIGADKLDHFFDQGYEYYRNYLRAEAKLPEGEAPSRSYSSGVAQESSIYGTLLTGVYSNADLASNYAGLKFYLNITRYVDINGVTYRPKLILVGNHWAMNPDYSETDFMKPFISEHMSEALNPSNYAFCMNGLIRSAVKARCKRWLRLHPEFNDKDIVDLKLEELKTWYGEPYGHRGGKGLPSIGSICF